MPPPRAEPPAPPRRSQRQRLLDRFNPRRGAQWDQTDTYLLAVTYNDPPGVPRALRGLGTRERLDVLRTLVRAAEQPAGMVVDRFPGSVAAALWVSAVGQLADITGTPTADYLRDLVSLFDQAANAVIALDASVADVLRPLRSDSGPMVPPVRGWLAAGDWRDSERLLRANTATLTNDETIGTLDRMVAGSPGDLRLAAQAGLLRLAKDGQAEGAYRYLGTSDPYRRRELLLEMVMAPRSTPETAAALVGLARGGGHALLGSELADLDVLQAILDEIAGRHGEAVSRVRELRRFRSDRNRYELQELLIRLADRWADQAAAVQAVRRTVTRCT